jgi:hypothetical protein
MSKVVKRKGHLRVGRWIRPHLVRTRIGSVGVDSGRLRIADPSYDATATRNFGVMVEDFGGDGLYPVYRYADRKGRTRKIVVEF